MTTARSTLVQLSELIRSALPPHYAAMLQGALDEHAAAVSALVQHGGKLERENGEHRAFRAALGRYMQQQREAAPVVPLRPVQEPAPVPDGSAATDSANPPGADRAAVPVHTEAGAGVASAAEGAE